jgi:hypothetical protein
VLWVATGFIYQRARIESRGVFLGLTVTGTVAGASGGANTGFVLNGLLVEYEEVTVLASRMQV